MGVHWNFTKISLMQLCNYVAWFNLMDIFFPNTDESYQIDH